MGTSLRRMEKGEILTPVSRENVELLRVAFENFLAGKSEFGAELLDPEIEWDATESPVLDIRGVYRGTEAVRQFWREWLIAWETVQFEYELLDAGDRVVALIDQRMRGRSTGIEVPFGKYAHVYTFKDGLVVHWKAYMSQAEALEAVGLSQDTHTSP
jgi:ketosteroid isomerase-like protein